MYEHSYHMDYGAKAAAYVDAYLNNINWQTASTLYKQSPWLREGTIRAAGDLPEIARSQH